MIGNIPNLWPEIADSEAEVTPKAVLDRQGMVITEKTKGKVRGEVETKLLGSDFVHALWLVAPELANYRHFVVRVRHSVRNTYPLKVLLTEKDDTGKICETEADFYTLLGSLLKHERTISVVLSLIAQSG